MKKPIKKLLLIASSVIIYSHLDAQNLISIWQNYNPPTSDDNNPAFWGVQSAPCIPLASPWVLGGNNMPYPGSITSIGTCNKFPFILKADNQESIFLMPNSYVGIGLYNYPQAALDIKNTDADATKESNFRIYADGAGNVESTTDINLTFAANKVLNFNEGTAASNTTRMSVLPGGRVVVGPNYYAATANYKLDVYATGHDGVNVAAAGTTKAFNVFDYNSLKDNFTVLGSGKTIIGVKTHTTGAHANAMLTVYGKAVATEVIVTQQNWSDFVFDKNYKLMPLEELESYYKVNKHLPSVPSEKEIIKEGNDLAKTDAVLLQKIEELTLYLVEQQKQISDLKEALGKINKAR